LKSIVVLASGRGTDLQSILDAIESGYIRDARVVAVVSNNKDAYALQRARSYGAEPIYIDHRGKKRVEHEKEMIEAIDHYRPDLIVLAGWMRALTHHFIEHYRWKIINIHPALLPLFGGKGFYGERVHKAVLESGMKVSGCTVHFVTEDVDGGPIILQRCVPVKDDDTVETLAERVLEEEHRCLPEAVKLFLEGKVRVEGKRTVIS
jgi:phosphoribosylglycinamide formyltransferase-1